MQSKQISQIIIIPFIILLYGGCTDIGTPINIPQEDMTLRQVVGMNYQNVNFFIGTKVKTGYLTDELFYPLYSSEFKCSAPDSVFSQAVAYPQLNGSWWGDGYRKFFTDARRQSQMLKANASISSECSASIKDDNVSKNDLDSVMVHYLKVLGSELESNKDVVKWMEVINDPIAVDDVKGLGYNRESSTNTITYRTGDFLGPRAGITEKELPWIYLGFDTINVNNTPFALPKYISKAFVLANQYAPNIKKLFVQDIDNMDTVVLKQLKKSILALRAKGIKIDGIGWKGIVSLGWETNIENIQQLSSFIDWCNTNNIEFYVTNLQVKVSDTLNDNVALLFTGEAQAETFRSIMQLIISKAGNGVNGVWFGLFTGESVNGKTYGNLFDLQGNKTVSYNSVHSLLINR